MIRLREIALPFDHSAKQLRQAVLKTLKLSEPNLRDLTIVRRSIDARRKNRIIAVYIVDVNIKNEAKVLERLKKNPKITHIKPEPYRFPKVEHSSKQRVVVVGVGPCGLFASLLLAQAGLKPLLIERGKKVRDRIADVHGFWKGGPLNPHSNVQFGEGGAGTFSDGKLVTQIKRQGNRIRKVLEELVTAGGPKEILYAAKPHIGTDYLVRVVKNLRMTIQDLGGEIRFESQLTNIHLDQGRVTGIEINHKETIDADVAVLALGHSARDTFKLLDRLAVPMVAKPFSLGVRIEHPQSLIDKAQYGEQGGHPALGAADYKLVHHGNNERSAYTFCMCPGGEVIASASELEQVVTNGMSHYQRNRPNANSALLVGVKPEDFQHDGPLGGIEFQRHWERRAFEIGGGNYHAPVQRVEDFLAGRASQDIGAVEPSYQPGIRPCDLAECLPDFVTQTLREALPALDRKLKGFADADAIMTGVESRSSSPLRILRDEGLQSPAIKGLYPAGEGAGYAGGIVSAAVDGIKVAEAIAARP